MILDDYLGSLETLATQRPEDCAAMIADLLKAHGNSSEDLCKIATSTTPTFPLLAKKSPMLATKVINRILDFDHIKQSPQTLHHVVDATFAVFPQLLDKGGDLNAMQLLFRLSTLNAEIPEGLISIKNAAPTLVSKVADHPWVVAAIVNTVLTHNATKSCSEMITSAIDIIPTIAVKNMKATMSVMNALLNVIPKTSEEFLRLKTSALSILPHLAEDDIKAAATLLSTLLPNISAPSESFLCKHFARSTTDNGNSVVWFIPTSDKILVLDDTSTLKDFAHYQKITAEGTSLKDLFSGHATLPETAEKIQMETGTHYHVLEL